MRRNLLQGRAGRRACFLCYHPQFRPGGVAQLVERLVRNEEADGSSPFTSTNKSLLELFSATARVRPKNPETPP
jgi:hypothetical protein